MKFLSVRPDVCRQLPSDSNSRWTPLLWAVWFPLLGLIRDLHPLANTHTERTMMNGKCGLRLHPQSVAKMKVKLKELTSRSNGWGYAKLKDKLNQFINGWMNYFKLADMRNILQTTDKWLRHRIRSYVWKSWKKVGARFKNLVRCGIDRWRAWQWANTRGGYWNTAGSPILCRAMNNERLKLQGYPCLVDLYVKLHQH